MSYSTQLASVQAAIAAIEDGAQSFTMAGGDGGSLTVNRGSLADLYSRERWLQRQVAREVSGGIKAQTGVPMS